MLPIDVGIALLLLHGLLGGGYALYNHERNARLAVTAAAAPELTLHAGRSAFDALLFAGLAWFEWQGALVLVLAVVVLGEFALTLIDSVVEERTREVSLIERVVHLVRAVTTGAWAGFVFHTAVNDWWWRPTALVGTAYGVVSWLLTAMATVLAFSALRDAASARELERQARFLAPARLLRRRPALAGE